MWYDFRQTTDAEVRELLERTAKTNYPSRHTEAHEYVVRGTASAHTPPLNFHTVPIFPLSREEQKAWRMGDHDISAEHSEQQAKRFMKALLADLTALKVLGIAAGHTLKAACAVSGRNRNVSSGRCPTTPHRLQLNYLPP
ncbi:MAG: hypothetical protein U0Y68_01610 [Blastocatellia bacterium]